VVVVADRLAGGTDGSSFFAGGIIAFFSISIYLSIYIETPSPPSFMQGLRVVVQARYTI